MAYALRATFLTGEHAAGLAPLCAGEQPRLKTIVCCLKDIDRLFNQANDERPTQAPYMAY